MIRAFFKLKKRDRLVIAIASVAVIVGFFVGIYFLLSGVGFVAFPDSVLQKNNRIQSYVHRTSKLFPEQIQINGTEFGIYVGGEELSHTDCSAAFSFTDDMKIVISEMKLTDDNEQFIASEYSRLLGLNEGTFHEKVYDKGYLNTFETEYIGGILSSGKDREYIVAYKVPQGGHVFLIGFATDKKYELKECFFMLNMVYTTMFRYGSVTDSFESGMSSDNVTVSEDGTSVTVTTPTIDLYDGREYNTVEEVLEAKEADDYRLKYPDSTDIKAQVTVTRELTEEQVAFAFEYVYGDATPSSAVLTSPSGKEYTPDYYNSDKDARIVFVIDHPEAGAWTFTISDDAEMGAYDVHVMKYMDYQDAIKSSYSDEYDPMGESRETIEVQDERITDPSTGGIIYMTGE